MEDEIEWHVDGATVPTWAIVAWVGAVLAVLAMVAFLMLFPEQRPQQAGKANHGSAAVPHQAGDAGSQPGQGER